jgi:hypothetical protein
VTIRGVRGVMRPASRCLTRPLRALALIACAVTVLAFAPTAGAATQATSGLPSSLSGDPGARPNVAATLEQCLTSSLQAERSATFTGEMAAIAGSTKMEMRIDVLERLPHEMLFHTVTAPGLGVWRVSTTGVKVYKYLKQVTNLSAPAFYRAAIRYRWLSAKGKIVKTAELHTPKCEQPPPLAPPEGTASETPPAPASTATNSAPIAD